MKKLLLIIFFAAALSTYCIAQDSTAYSDYYGKYKMPEGMDVTEVTIQWQDSSLNIGSDMGNAKMDKLGEDSFHMDYQDGTLKFLRDSSTHKVNGLIIYIQGQMINATKEEDAKTNGTSWIRKDLFDDKIYLN
jgi:hypothetical protein